LKMEVETGFEPV